MPSSSVRVPFRSWRRACANGRIRPRGSPTQKWPPGRRPVAGGIGSTRSNAADCSTPSRTCCRDAKVRVLLLMDPFIRVPPEHYGGIERVIADLADGLVAHGHEVTLWAAPGSRSRGRLEPYGC